MTKRPRSGLKILKSGIVGYLLTANKVITFSFFIN